MTVRERRNREDRNLRIKWMIQDVISLCLIVVIVTGTLLLIKGMI